MRTSLRRFRSAARQLKDFSLSSMSIYQFLIAVRQQDGTQLMNESGETTRSYRLSRCLDDDTDGVHLSQSFDGIVLPHDSNGRA